MNKWLVKVVGIRDGFVTRKINYLAQKELWDKLSKHRVCEIKLLKEFNEDKYLQACQNIYQGALSSLKEKRLKKVVFVVANASMWSCDVLYSLFQQDDQFDVSIVITYPSGTSGQDAMESYRKTCAFFSEQGYRCVEIPLNTPRKKCYEAMGSPDIVFYLSPYSIHEPTGCNLYNLPQSVLTIYIPYSYMLSDAPNKFHKPGMDDTWRHFADSEFYKELLITDDPLKKRNTYFVGYPKMDVYYEPATADKKDIWKFADGGENAKCIIYAPHHSLPSSNVCTQHFSTFHSNYREILQLAKDHPLTTSWIIKPHPLLIETSVETGLFMSATDYEKYLAEWEALPNARVVEESTYYDIFKTSDAMILDSVSFIAEYQFTGKPALFLTKEGQKFNEFGQSLQKVMYHASGNNIEDIKAFVEDVVINNNDPLAPERKRFFDDNLNYRKNGEPSASEQIYRHILEAIEAAK